MLLGAIAHGMELVPGLDLCHGQRHRRAMMKVVEGDLQNAGRNVMKASVDEGAPSVNGICDHVCHQLEGLQLHCQG